MLHSQQCKNYKKKQALLKTFIFRAIERLMKVIFFFLRSYLGRRTKQKLRSLTGRVALGKNFVVER